MRHNLAPSLTSLLSHHHALGRKVQHFATIDSTNQEVMRQAAAGAAEGLVIMADEQSAGRGRLGRRWHTTEEALALSLLLRPKLPPEKVPQLSLVTAVALQQALQPYCAEIRIKWPNDLLIQGAKVAGILTEMRAKPGQVEAVVVGIGINLQPPKGGWPETITQPATDLQTHALSPITRLDCAAALLQSLDLWYRRYLQHGFTPVREAWWQAHVASGQKVRVFNGKTYIEGIATALDDDGALLLDVHGEMQRIIAGEVYLKEVDNHPI